VIINTELLDNLTSQAKSSPRLRQHYDLRDGTEDGSQRMLNAIEPGTVIEVHRHTGTSETVVALRGVAEEVFFDADGNEMGRYKLTPGGMEPGSLAAIQVPMGQYHTLRSLESGTVIIEFKNGRYDPESDKCLMNLKSK
jgi:cupin fold WbuC family metalloprotein